MRTSRRAEDSSSSQEPAGRVAAADSTDCPAKDTVTPADEVVDHLEERLLIGLRERRHAASGWAVLCGAQRGPRAMESAKRFMFRSSRKVRIVPLSSLKASRSEQNLHQYNLEQDCKL